MSDVIGFVYKADVYCMDHVVGQIPNVEQQTFSSSADVNDFIEDLAKKEKINYDDQYSYDSDDFPKPILRFESETGQSNCGVCGIRI